VEGDLGLYHNLDSLLAASGRPEDDVRALRERLSIPTEADEAAHGS
jgi:hypothetical protein